MINIIDKKDCCGCSACAQICSYNCIIMTEDNEGFLYPQVDKSKCIDCGLCSKVCPVLNHFEIPNEKPISFACKSLDDDLVDKSSSGGFFTVLAEYVINKGGIVFGARFDSQWNVVYDFTDTIEGIAPFRGSKYVQGYVGKTFMQVKSFLKEGKLILFTGTPCHISGLNHFLNKKYQNLITMDFVCHSIPSPKVWRDYLKSIYRGQNLSHVTFRDKSFGWDNYGLLIVDEKQKILIQGVHKENIYMKAFLSNLTARPSCFACPARNYTSGSDFMIADCWGFDTYHPEINNNKGMSLVLPKTENAIKIFNEIQKYLFVLQIPYNEVEEETNHRPIIKSATPNHYRAQFFKHYSEDNLLNNLQKYVTKGEQRKKFINNLKSIVRAIAGKHIIKYFRKIHE